jgi:hypothetical protein
MTCICPLCRNPRPLLGSKLLFIRRQKLRKRVCGECYAKERG